MQGRDSGCKRVKHGAGATLLTKTSRVAADLGDRIANFFVWFIAQ